MKKTYLARRNALLSSANLSWGTFALACALLALLLRLLAPNLFWYVVTPVFRIGDVIAEKNHAFLGSFGDAAALTVRNEQLRNENAALANENATLLQKTASLEALFAASLSGEGVESIIAGVVARPPTSPYDTLVLSRGADAGVVLGMGAFGEGGVPLGFISSVLDDFSRVTLFSSPGVVVDGWAGNAHVPLTIFGSGAGTMRSTISRSAGIAVGDAIFVPGPGLLPIGSVVRVDSDSSSPSSVLQIQPAIGPFSVTWVELRATGPVFAASLSWATTTP